MSKGKKNKKQYLSIDYLVFRESGWSKEDMEHILNQFIEAVETVKGQAGGGAVLLTEEEVNEQFSKDDEEE